MMQNLNIVINFIDRTFVEKLFSEEEDSLLEEVNPVLNKIVEAMIPEFDFCTNKFN